MFGVVVGKVGGTLAPVHMKLTLANSITEPIVSHVHGFRASLLDGIIGNSACCAVVGYNRGGWLGMPKFSECDAFWCSFLTIVV